MTLYDYNVFAVLTAHDKRNKARSAFNLPHNAKWFRRAVGGVASQPLIASREVTPAPEKSHAHDEKPGDVERLVVVFDEVENPVNGIQLGTSTVWSHILLGYRGTQGISAKQCNITVDDDLRIWLHDYCSTHGTAVGYNDQNQEEVHKKETWILAYPPGTRNRLGDISVHLGSLAFKIEFPNHTKADPRYVENLRAFAGRCKEAADALKEVPGIEGLGLDSERTTKPPTGAHTPGERLIYFKDKRVGKGTFGQVFRLIRARDGKFFAGKSFMRPANKRKRGEADMKWLTMLRTEFSILKDNPHHNIMQVFEFRETREPLIIMEYYAAGNIRDANITNFNLHVTALGQILDGVSHLHRKNIAHRDLKPENILVEMKPLFKVVITDFGFAKVAVDSMCLRSVCGTVPYQAPETCRGFGDGHDARADVWSLGIIALEWLYGLPPQPATPESKVKLRSAKEEKWCQWVRTWTELLAKKIKEEDDCLLLEIILHMIKIKPHDRWSVDRCLQYGFDHDIFKRRSADGLVTYASDPECFTSQADEGVDKETMTPTTVSAALTQDDSGTETPTAASARSPPSRFVHPKSVDGNDIFGTAHRRGNGNNRILLPYEVAPDGEESPNRRESSRPRPQAVSGARLSIPRDQSHLSTRTVMFEEDLAYLVIQRRRVTICRTDGRLNATQLFLLAGLPRPAREKYLYTLKCHCEVTHMQTRLKDCWIPFEHGVFLCQALGLLEQMEPLLLQASLSLPTEGDNYFLERVVVRCIPSQMEMSASGLLWASGKRNWPSAAILSAYNFRKIRFEYYTSFNDGLDLAKRLSLRDSSLEILASWTKKEPTAAPGAAIICLEKLELIPETHKVVHIIPRESLINASNILACVGLRRTVRAFLKENHFTALRFIRGKVMQGTYISYAEGLRLCELINIPLEEVKLAMDEGWIGPIIEILAKVPRAKQHQREQASDLDFGEPGSLGAGSDEGNDSNQIDEVEGLDQKVEIEEREETMAGGSVSTLTDPFVDINAKISTPGSLYSTPFAANSPLPQFIPVLGPTGELSVSFGLTESD